MPTPENRARAIADAIRRRGQRMTPQRMAVIKEFLARTDHPSAESIHQALKADFDMMAVSTVYDTLRLLVELGEAAEVG
ncbi:MAG: transcriptional repressor, partial [Armatimonadia bacterium]|nr:transcriptional repressor [Armatimonadia bacterium]